jgi:hypothetical protein
LKNRFEEERNEEERIFKFSTVILLPFQLLMIQRYGPVTPNSMTENQDKGDLRQFWEIRLEEKRIKEERGSNSNRILV